MNHNQSVSTSALRYHGGSDVEQQPATRTQALVARLRDIAQEVEHATDRTQRDADRLTGNDPGTGSKSGPEPVPSGSLGELEQAVSVLHGRLAALISQTERFNAI